MRGYGGLTVVYRSLLALVGEVIGLPNVLSPPLSSRGSLQPKIVDITAMILGEGHCNGHLEVQVFLCHMSHGQISLHTA